jgi:DNA-binding NarL/FixJ family response regulator
MSVFVARRQLNPVPRTRVFLVDDEPVVRRGLRLLFSAQPDLEVCGEAGSEAEALEGIQAQRPDLAIVDLSLKKGGGLGLIQQLHKICPAIKILVFSMHDQVHYAATAFAAGADGYVIKEEGAEWVLDAIKTILRGGRYLSERVAAKAPHLVTRLGQRGGIRPR